MSFAARTLRTYGLVASTGLLAILAETAGAGEIFKCVAKDGTPLYQNFPCSIDSLGFAPSLPTGVGPSQAKPGGMSANATAAKLSKAEDVRVGMTSEEVIAILGQPEETVEDEPAVGGRVSNWRFSDGRVVQFDHRHRVLGVQR